MDISFKRIVAYIIDLAIISLVISLLGSIKIINPYFDKYQEKYETYTELIKDYQDKKIAEDEYQKEIKSVNYDLTKYNVINQSITIVGLFVYFGIIQKVMNGQTFGKKIVKIKLVHQDEKQKLGFGNTIIRSLILNNIIFRILVVVGPYFLNVKSFYYYSTTISFIESLIESIILIMVVLKKNNRGLHDILAKTKVIDLNPLVIPEKEELPKEEKKVIETKTKEKTTKKKSKISKEKK